MTECSGQLQDTQKGDLQMVREIGEPELQERFDRAMSCITREIAQEYKQERRLRQTRERELFKARKQFVRALLEQYRSAPEGTWVRKTVASLILAHRDTGESKDWYKTDHNITVLRYLVKESLSDREICNRLEIGMSSLEKGTTRTIERMTVLLYGIDGINPGRWETGARV